MAGGQKTGGRQKSQALSSNLLAGFHRQPKNAQEWLENAELIISLVRTGPYSLKAVAEALARSEPYVGWYYSFSRWPDKLKVVVRLYPARFPPSVLFRLARKQHLFSDLKPRSSFSSMDLRAKPNGRKSTLEAEIARILEGKEPRSAPPLSKLRYFESLANSERSRAFDLRRKLENVLSESNRAKRQSSLDQFAELSQELSRVTLENARLQSLLRSSNVKATDIQAPTRSNDVKSREDHLRSVLKCKLNILDWNRGILQINAGVSEVLEGILEKFAFPFDPTFKSIELKDIPSLELELSKKLELDLRIIDPRRGLMQIDAKSGELLDRFIDRLLLNTK